MNNDIFKDVTPDTIRRAIDDSNPDNFIFEAQGRMIQSLAKQSMEAMEALAIEAATKYPELKMLSFYDTMKYENGSVKLTTHPLVPDENGRTQLPNGISSVQTVDLDKVREYLEVLQVVINTINEFNHDREDELTPDSYAFTGLSIDNMNEVMGSLCHRTNAWIKPYSFNLKSKVKELSLLLTSNKGR